MTDTFNYMTKHPYTSILTAVVSATVGTALVAQALEAIGIIAGAISMTGIAAMLSIAGIMAVMGVQKTSDKLANIIVDNLTKGEYGNTQNNNNKDSVAAIHEIALAANKIKALAPTTEKIIEPIALGRALSAVGFFATKPRASITVGLEKEFLPPQIK